MGCSQVVFLSRWMERIRQEQQTGDEARVLRSENGRLPPAVGMAAKQDGRVAGRENGLAQPGPVTLGIAVTRRTVRPLAAEWERVPDDPYAALRECVIDRSK